MFKDIQFSEDGKSVVVNAGELPGTDDGTGDGTKEVAVEDIMNLDVSQFPEEFREEIGKFKTVVGDQFAELGKLRPKADLSDVLMQNMANQNPGGEQGTVTGEPSPVVVKDPLDDALQFEDNDYYAKFFKVMHDEIKDLKTQVGTVSSNVSKNKQEGFVSTVKTFMTEKKVPPTTVMKMDEVAKKLGPNAYNDLDLLLRVANMELGIVAETKEKTPDPNKQVTNRQPGREAVTTFGNKKKIGITPKKINNMQDAFDKFVEDASAQG